MNGSGILNNIWNELSSNNLTQSDFDTWKSNFIQNPDVQSNVYNYLVENNLTQSSGEDWVANINKDLQAQQPAQEKETKTPKQLAMEGIWQSDVKLSTKLAVSAEALVQSLKNPEERKEIKENVKNIKNDLPLGLANAFRQFELYSMDALNKTFGDKATDYLAKNKWVPSGLEVEEEVGDATDLFMSNKMKEIEATKLLYRYDGKGMVKGVKTGDASDVIGGVLNSVSSMVQTMGPAILTRGASLFPQITSPMYYEYNKAKARQKYGDVEGAMEKLVAEGKKCLYQPL